MIREWITYIITVPFVTIAPDTVCPSEQDIQNLENEYELHFVRAKEMFNRHYQDIEDVLCFNNKRLNQTKYKIDNIPKYMNQLGAFFSDAPVSRLPGELLYKFQTRKIIEGTNKNQTPPMHPFFDACESVIDTYSNLEKLYENKMAYIKKEFMQNAQSQLIEKKKKLQIQSFDDLLHYVYNALKNDIENRLAHSLRKQYQAALIDEFQDTDPLQYQIFYRIFNDSQCALYIIGDPKQAIYSFRGADLFAYLKGVQQTDHQYTLDTNWRSSPLLVNAINTIFMQNPNAFVYGDIAFHKVTSALPQIQLYLGKDQAPQTPLQLMYINNPDTGKKQLSKEKAREIIYKQVGDHINTLLNLARNNQALLNDRALQAGDIAILVRKNYEARHIQMALHERGIPGVVYSQERVWESRICMDIAHVMAAVADYQNEQHLKSAFTSALIGMNADTLIETTGDSNLWDEWIQRFQHYHEIWRKKGFMIMFRLLLARENVRARILSMPDGERLLTDLLHIAELLHQVDMEKKPGMSGLLEYFNRYRAGEQYTKHESHIRLETDENAVKIVTIHKSKGLQYNIVYCPFLWDGAKIKTKKPFVFHDPDNNHTLTLPITQEARESCKKRAQMEYLAENMRLFYVALTRARYHCFLVHGDINESSSSPLSWLLHGKPCIQNNRVPNTIVDQLNTLIGKMSSTAIEDALNNLARDSQETIQVSFDSWVLPEIDTAKSPVLKDRQTVTKNLSCLQLNQTIDSNWRVTSFSALTSNKTHASEIPDHDTFTKDIGILEEKQPKPGTIFAFPKGARPGTFMHELLELVDFEKADTTQIGLLVNEKLTEYGFDPKWQDTIAALIHRVRNAQLSTNDPDFRFCHIPAAHGINELGFYFQSTIFKPIALKGLLKMFHG
ncbi:MAG: exodeoxyribonuclease V beta subunit [Candidatus Magnetoglobus multicellularis str. Araruama]|uniref:DNA 3'-5' helicase n=1 Tax=Candidatus Magnetoglobus multicellularis str. Araruama TaxID=890399 RepID=A0A1V1P8P4_9BACT|nr:MAG: exodeoxyribonuclease V beta subunit [Candidatus Magnetoglobus multicellularis str. Araruama]